MRFYLLFTGMSPPYPPWSILEVFAKVAPVTKIHCHKWVNNLCKSKKVKWGGRYFLAALYIYFSLLLPFRGHLQNKRRKDRILFLNKNEFHCFSQAIHCMVLSLSSLFSSAKQSVGYRIVIKNRILAQEKLMTSMTETIQTLRIPEMPKGREWPF